jgi:hypothetical protein
MGRRTIARAAGLSKNVVCVRHRAGPFGRPQRASDGSSATTGMHFSEVTELEPPQMWLQLSRSALQQRPAFRRAEGVLLVARRRSQRRLDRPRSFLAFGRLLKRETDDQGSTTVSLGQIR